MEGVRGVRAVQNALLAEYSAGQWVLVFFLYSIAGWCWEVALCLARERRLVNRGFLRGPMLPIYGFGATGILLSCVPVREHVAAVALVGMLVASALEYAAGWLIEALFHVRYWNYLDCPYNLNGYVCLASCATWAAFSVLVVCVIHPLCMPLIRRVPPTAALALSAGLAVFALGDAALSVRHALDLRALLELITRGEAGNDARTAARTRRAHGVLRRNPRAASRRYGMALASLREIGEKA